jgi:hypothetical protein
LRRLGYTFSSVGLTGIARRTVEKFVERASRLYEQGADAVRIPGAPGSGDGSGGRPAAWTDLAAVQSPPPPRVQE